MLHSLLLTSPPAQDEHPTSAHVSMVLAAMRETIVIECELEPLADILAIFARARVL